MGEPLVEPFEVRETVPEFLTTNGISKKERTSFSPHLQDESLHKFLFVEREILRHIQIVNRDPGESPAIRNFRVSC